MPRKPDPSLEQLISAWLDGHIDQEASDRLQQRLRESAADRQAFIAMTQVDAGLRGLADRGDEDAQPPLGGPVIFASPPVAVTKQRAWAWARMAVAAAVLLVVGGAAFWLGSGNRAAQTVGLGPEQPGGDLYTSPEDEETIAGYATLRRVAGVTWSKDAPLFREGDVLPAGVLALEEGVVEIDFFCGAGVIIEGPARIDLESDWSMRLASGRLRANVPPAARGFVVKTEEADIVDLGTEFSLDVSPKHVRVEVIDGEVALRGGAHDGSHLVTGEGLSLKGLEQEANAMQPVVSREEVDRHRQQTQRLRFKAWQSQSQELRRDDRLIAYYPIADLPLGLPGRVVTNQAASGSGLDGSLVGWVNQGQGRFGPASVGLEFDRPGSRVRARIDGSFSAFTFACWTRIDSLKNRYNALFMGDGYENGEPHWQIRDDGRLMFSVMVDDQPEPGRDKATLDRLHRVYFTDSVWDISMSGRWLHIAAVYDPVGRRVKQYVNGQLVGDEAILDKFFIDKLHIGSAEIGNWGQPFRQTPWFAVRNLNGSIDEMAIFDAALTGDEILGLYEAGKSVGY